MAFMVFIFFIGLVVPAAELPDHKFLQLSRSARLHLS